MDARRREISRTYELRQISSICLKSSIISRTLAQFFVCVLKCTINSHKTRTACTHDTSHHSVHTPPPHSAHARHNTTANTKFRSGSRSVAPRDTAMARRNGIHDDMIVSLALPLPAGGSLDTWLDTRPTRKVQGASFVQLFAHPWSLLLTTAGDPGDFARLAHFIHFVMLTSFRAFS